MKAVFLQLGLDEYDRLVTTLEGAKEELEEVERTLDYFVSETPERIEDCLRFLQLSAQTSEVQEDGDE